MSNISENLQHSIPPTAEEAAAFANQAVISTLQREEVVPYANYFRPNTMYEPSRGGPETWTQTAKRAGSIIMNWAEETALKEGMTQEQWDTLRIGAVREGHAPSSVVLEARLLNEATKHQHKNLCLEMAGIVLHQMQGLEQYKSARHPSELDTGLHDRSLR